MLISIQSNWLHLPADLLRAELNFHRGEELSFHFTLTCFSSTFLIELHVRPRRALFDLSFLWCLSVTDNKV